MTQRVPHRGTYVPLIAGQGDVPASPTSRGCVGELLAVHRVVRPPGAVLTGAPRVRSTDARVTDGSPRPAVGTPVPWPIS